DTRRMVADRVVSARVFGAIQQIHLPVLHDGRGIKGGMLLPPNDGVGHGREERGRGTGRDRRVHLSWFVKGTKHPRTPLPARRLYRHRARRGQEHDKDGDASHHTHRPTEALQRAASARSVTAPMSVRTFDDAAARPGPSPATTGWGWPPTA